MKRGLPTYMKEITKDLRGELGLSQFERADPWAACALLDIPVVALTDLNDQHGIIGYFAGAAGSEFSAVTSFIGTRRFIVYNDFHHPYRQTSSLAHEIGHAMLQHPAAPILRGDGVRNWDGELEQEAAVFAGVLLVPDEACRWVLKRAMTLEESSNHFGVSTSMVEYRLRVSGAYKIQQRTLMRGV